MVRGFHIGAPLALQLGKRAIFDLWRRNAYSVRFNFKCCIQQTINVLSFYYKSEFSLLAFFILDYNKSSK
jgi:hypothetical protein